MKMKKTQLKNNKLQSMFYLPKSKGWEGMELGKYAIKLLINQFKNKRQMEDKSKNVENSTNIGNEVLVDLRQRTLFDKLKYWFICRKKGHTVSRVHPKYPSQYCSVCRKHRSEF